MTVPAETREPRSVMGLVVLVAVLLGLSPLLYFDALQNPSALPRYTLIAIGSGVGLVAWAFLAWRQRLPFRFHPVQLLVLGFVLFANVSAAWSADVDASIIELTQLWGFFFLYLLVSQLASERAVFLWVVVSVVAATLAALIGLGQNFGFQPVVFRDFYQMGSTFFYKNHAALYFDLIVGPALILVMLADNNRWRWLAAMALLFLLGFLLESHTRGSWLALTIAMMVLATVVFFRGGTAGLIDGFKAQKWKLLTALLGAFVILSLPGAIDRVWDRSVAPGQMVDESSQIRLTAYKNALHMLPENLLVGTGYGGFRQSFRTHMNHPYVLTSSTEYIQMLRLHSDPLQAFVELGVIGGSLFLGIGIWILYLAWKLFADQRLPRCTSLLALGLGVGLLTSFIHSFVDFPFHKPSSAMQIWIWAGVLTGLAASPRPLLPELRKYLLVIAMLGVGYLLWAAWFYSAYITSNRELREVDQALKKKDCASALEKVDLAVRHFRFYFGAHTKRTRVHIVCNDNPQWRYLVLNSELEWDPTNVLALIERGRMLRSGGQLKAAERDFQRVIDILPHRPRARLELAATYLEMGRREDAAAMLATVKPGDAEGNDLSQFYDLLRKRLIP